MSVLVILLNAFCAHLSYNKFIQGLCCMFNNLWIFYVRLLRRAKFTSQQLFDSKDKCKITCKLWYSDHLKFGQFQEKMYAQKRETEYRDT